MLQVVREIVNNPEDKTQASLMPDSARYAHRDVHCLGVCEKRLLCMRCAGSCMLPPFLSSIFLSLACHVERFSSRVVADQLRQQCQVMSRLHTALQGSRVGATACRLIRSLRNVQLGGLVVNYTPSCAVEASAAPGEAHICKQVGAGHHLQGHFGRLCQTAQQLLSLLCGGCGIQQGLARRQARPCKRCSCHGPLGPCALPTAQPGTALMQACQLGRIASCWVIGQADFKMRDCLEAYNGPPWHAPASASMTQTAPLHGSKGAIPAAQHCCCPRLWELVPQYCRRLMRVTVCSAAAAQRRLGAHRQRHAEAAHASPKGW